MAPGANATFTLTVTNNGPGAATGVTVTDSIPAGLTYVSNTCGASYAAPTVTWNIGALANAASISCNIVVTVPGRELPQHRHGERRRQRPGLDQQRRDRDGNGQQSVLEIPTLGTVGLFALGVGLLVASLALLRRRRLS